MIPPPLTLKARELGFHELGNLWSQPLDYPGNIYTVRRPVQPDQEEMARRLVAALVESTHRVVVDRPLAVAVLGKYVQSEDVGSNEEAVGVWVVRTEGAADAVEAYDRLLLGQQGDWFLREVRLYLKRVLKRIDVSSRSVFALIEPGSCFVGTLLELALAADRSYMLDGTLDDTPAPALRLTAANFGAYPTINGLSRLAARFLKEPGRVDDLKGRVGQDLDAAAAAEAGLVTFTPDDIDWEDEVRQALEARAAFSPDALTGMEASLRFGGPETLETKIFGRLSAWQNWIFQRPNAVGPKGALQVYGTGERSDFDRRRV